MSPARRRWNRIASDSIRRIIVNDPSQIAARSLQDACDGNPKSAEKGHASAQRRDFSTP
jgi:hypothetical protein